MTFSRESFELSLHFSDLRRSYRAYRVTAIVPLSVNINEMKGVLSVISSLLGHLHTVVR